MIGSFLIASFIAIGSVQVPKESNEPSSIKARTQEEERLLKGSYQAIKEAKEKETSRAKKVFSQRTQHGLVRREFIEVKSPGYSPLKQDVEYVEEVYTNSYSSTDEFLLTLLFRKDIAKELGVSEQQIEDLKELGKEIQSLRAELSLLISKKRSVRKENKSLSERKDLDRQENDEKKLSESEEELTKDIEATIEELKKTAEKKLDKILLAQQKKRLKRLHSQLLFSQYRISDVAVFLDQIGELDQDKKDLFAKALPQLQAISQSFSKGFPADSPFSKGVFAVWANEILSDSTVVEIQNKLTKFGVLPGHSALLNDLKLLDQKQYKRLTPRELWRVSGKIVFHPNGQIRRSLNETGKVAGELNFLRNLVESPSYEHFFDLATEQKILARSKWIDQYKDPEPVKELESFLKDIFLDHQMKLLDVRTAWREVEVFGLPNALVHGRLGEIYKLTAAQKKKLKSSSEKTLDAYHDMRRAQHEKMVATLDSFFESRGLPKLASKSLGSYPKTTLFFD